MRLLSLSEYLGQQVLALIRGQSMAPGDRLPSVKDLAERFSVAAPTMREALRLLQMAGTLEIRHGSGSYVRHAGSRLMLANPLARSMRPDAILNLLSARLMVEPPVAALAALNASDKHLAELASLLANAERHLSGQDAEDIVLGVADMHFHRGIADGSGNPILSDVVFTLTQLQMAIPDPCNSARCDHAQHKLILVALQKRDGDGARALMNDHLADVMSVARTKQRILPFP